MKIEPEKQASSRPDASDSKYTIGLVQKHLNDPDHVITDEELRNIKITTEHIDVSEHPIVKGSR